MFHQTNAASGSEKRRHADGQPDRLACPADQNRRQRRLTDDENSAKPHGMRGRSGGGDRAVHRVALAFMPSPPCRAAATRVVDAEKRAREGVRIESPAPRSAAPTPPSRARRVSHRRRRASMARASADDVSGAKVSASTSSSTSSTAPARGAHDHRPAAGHPFGNHQAEGLGFACSRARPRRARASQAPDRSTKPREADAARRAPRRGQRAQLARACWLPAVSYTAPPIT